MADNEFPPFFIIISSRAKERFESGSGSYETNGETGGTVRIAKEEEEEEEVK